MLDLSPREVELLQKLVDFGIRDLIWSIQGKHYYGEYPRLDAQRIEDIKKLKQEYRALYAKLKAYAEANNNQVEQSPSTKENETAQHRSNLH